ncbi:hypothetical protein E4T39_00444 [Aureobasidium subglaciale]|nr:hypothetical protein E4T39_00444 [Aureobasidium subglaciale]
MGTDGNHPSSKDQAGDNNTCIRQTVDVFELDFDDDDTFSGYQWPTSASSGSDSSGWEVCESPEDLEIAERDAEIVDQDPEQLQESSMPATGSFGDTSVQIAPRPVEGREQFMFNSIERTDITAGDKIRQLQEMLKVVVSEREDARQRLLSNGNFVTDQYLQLKECHRTVAVMQSERDTFRLMIEEADRRVGHLDEVIHSDRMQAHYERQDAESKIAYMELQLSGAVETVDKERIEARLDHEALVAAARSNYDRERATTHECTRLGEKLIEMEAEKGNLVAKACKLECRLEAMAACEKNPIPCSDCPHFISENHKSQEREKSLQTKLQQSSSELESFRRCTTELVRGIQNHKAYIARLNHQIAALKEEARSQSEKIDQEGREDSIKLTDALKHEDPVQPLIMRIAVWVGGTEGTATEDALVKMSPDTPYKTVLESLRLHHPQKVLKQRSTGRFIFDSDTPAYLGVEDGEEFDFIQESGEPMFIFDATMTDTRAWRGKNGKV